MNAKSLSWIAAVVCLSLGGAYAMAQPKAQPKPGPAAPQTGAGCPMHGMSSIADAKVEETPQGAVLRLTAKRPEDVAKVREAAQRMIGCMSGADACMMHEGQGKHGGMMMQHGSGEQPRPSPQH